MTKSLLLKSISLALVVLLLSMLCLDYPHVYGGTTYTTKSSKGEKLSFKQVNTCWDYSSSRVIKPTKKQIKQADNLYKRLKRSGSKSLTLELTSKQYKSYEKVIQVMNWKYFPYYEPNSSMTISNRSIAITYKGKEIKNAIQQNKRVDSKIDKIVKSIGLTKKTTQYNAVILIDRYLCKNLEYCYDEKQYDRLAKQYGYNEYMALFSGKGVCQDYATCFKAIANRVGLKVGIAMSDSEDHAYNVVYVDGKKYYCDSCWNDCVDNNNFLFMTKKTNVHCVDWILW